MTKAVFTKKATPVPNYEGGTILKRQISQKLFYIWVMLPDRKKKIDALDVMLVEFLTDGGRLCQTRGAEIEKARSPVRVWDLGILHKMPLDERRK